MPLVEVENLRIDFGGPAAVDGVSLRLEQGERFGIIGESGSGKSLTALAITGLLPEAATASGAIRFAGNPLPTEEKTLARLRGRHIGMVFQEPMTALNPLMTIGAQIGEAITLVSRDAVPAAMPALLAEVGLEPDHARRYPHQLSGGQRQRAMIAMALAGQPELMIADEPTSALDVITQRMVLDLIAEVCRRRGMTLLFISHDIKAVAVLCQRIGVMRQGRLIEVGDTETLLAAPQQAYTERLLAASRMAPPAAAPRRLGETLLRVEGVSKNYGQGGVWPWKRPALQAVDGVRFEIASGERVALVGPSGCGKTTLARLIVGLDKASAGSFVLGATRYRGSDLPKGLRADLSLVFQDPFGSFDPRRTIAQSVAEPLQLVNTLSASEQQNRVAEVVMAVGLEPGMLARYPHEFSGGQRQRLAIARALVTRPRLVVLDEPVSALDVSVRGEVLALLARLRAEHGLTYLIISHDLDMVGAMADRVLVMERGRIVEEGRPAELFARPRHWLTKALMAARLPALG